jgi:hypothetical protein
LNGGSDKLTDIIGWALRLGAVAKAQTEFLRLLAGARDELDGQQAGLALFVPNVVLTFKGI